MTVRILVGDVRERLADLPDNYFHSVITSPPYYNLRDYGTAQWDGGDPACDHKRLSQDRLDALVRGSTLATKSDNNHEYHRDQFRAVCGKCGAVRIDNQIGLEPTLAAYLATMVEVFREVRRVLRPDGTLWLNIGDSMARNPAKGGSGTYNGRNGANDEYAGGSLGGQVEWELRDDLTPEETSYVLAELAKCNNL